MIHKVKDRTRPFLPEPVFHGAPASCAERYFQNRFERFREEHQDFDKFLDEIHNEIIRRNLDYCDNIILFLRGEVKPNWISPSDSLLRMFIKLYNYDFSPSQAVDYIEKCHKTYLYLLNDKLKLSNEYETSIRKCHYDGRHREFIEVSLIPVNPPKDWDDYYWINIIFCSLQNTIGDPDYFGDTKISIMSGRQIYEDSLRLFDLYQGSKYLHRVLDFTIEKQAKEQLAD